MAIKSKVVDYNSLYEAEYDYYTGSSSTTGFDGEGQIDSAIAYVTSDNIPVIYTLEGHSEMKVNSDLKNSMEKANYQIESLNLLTADGVPEDAGCLLIASPQNDLSEDEAKKIISYLENGGKAMIFTDYINLEMPNLKSVLETYGVTYEDGMVLEGNSKHYIMQVPYYLVPTINSTKITSEMVSDNRYVLMPVAQSVKILDEYRDSLIIEPILTTSESAYIKADVENMTTFEKEDGDQEGQFHLGVCISEQINDEKSTQIAYYSSASLIDSGTDQQVSGGNSELVMATLGWMCENETPVISVAGKTLTMDYLTVPEYDARYWSVITCGVIPVTFLLIGAVIWFKRRKQ